MSVALLRAHRSLVFQLTQSSSSIPSRNRPVWTAHSFKYKFHNNVLQYVSQRLKTDGPIPWWPQTTTAITMTATNNDGHKVYYDGKSSRITQYRENYLSIWNRPDAWIHAKTFEGLSCITATKNWESNCVWTNYHIWTMHFIDTEMLYILSVINQVILTVPLY